LLLGELNITGGNLALFSGNADFFLESLIDLRSEVFTSGADEKRNEEGEDTGKREEETDPLPEDVVTTVRSGKVVSSRHDKEPPESPWDEVLNGKTPPGLKDTFPPSSWLTGGLGELGHGSGDLSDTSEADLGVPLSEGKLAHAEGDNGTAEGGDDEDDDEDPVNVQGRNGSETNDTTDDKRNPVGESENKDGTLSVLLHNILSLIDPRDSEGLEETEQKHEVNGKVVINDIKEGETPVEAEDDGHDGTESAEDQGSQHSWGLLTGGGIIDDSGGSLNEGESGVNTKHEQGQGEEERPEVGTGEGLNGSGVSNESKTSGASSGGDGVTETVQVADNGEHSKTSEETEGAVTDGDDESVLDDRLVTRVVGSIRGHNTHANTKGEEDLSASISPNLSVTENFANNGEFTSSGVLTLEVHSDTGRGVGEGKSLHHKEEDEKDGEGHGEVNNIRRTLNTLEHAEEDDNPDEESRQVSLPGEGTSLVVSTGNVVRGVVVFAVRSDDSQEISEEVLFSDVEIIAILVRVERGSSVGNGPGQGVLE
jgi:hypothetical protein